MVSCQNLLRRPIETPPLPVWIVAIALIMVVAVTLACGGPAATPIPTPTGIAIASRRACALRKLRYDVRVGVFLTITVGGFLIDIHTICPRNDDILPKIPAA
jgi:hypothetical protein